VALAALALVGLGLWLRRRGARIPLRLTVPRLAATSVFVGLLVMHASVALVAHFFAVALFYLLCLEPIARGSLSQPDVER
jgi:hypothetical protein